ncbi:MAG: hypothetical protein VKL97_05865 [Cyanobacteriota bacterium]|nr:hypothetical protein [Cyanobacteriota bacterium]
MRARIRRPLRPPSTVVLVLGALSLWDLRIELQLLAQHFTVTALREALLAHPLAVAVLLLLPSLQRWISSSDPSAP